jgi:prepilin-type N-terminal cleavage/methylation domain-containing protein
MDSISAAAPRRRDARRGGFSLIELLLAVTIVGLLAGIAIPNLRSMTWQARAAEVAADIDVVRVATLSYNGDVFRWPAEASAGTVPPELSAGSEPYLPTGFSFQGNGYQLDYDYLSPVVIPGEPGTSQLIAVAVELDTDELSNAVLDLLGGTIVFSLGRRHTVLIDRS